MIGAALVTDCLDAVSRTVHGGAPINVDAMPGAVSHVPAVVGEFMRWMWRALSDILGPSGHGELHVRLNRLADEVLGMLPGAPPAWSPVNAANEAGEGWAGLAAERALIVAELAFFAWEAGDAKTSRAALNRAGGPAPALAGGMLPPLDAILARRGAERECLLTARQSVVQYNILLARDDLDALLANEQGQGQAQAPVVRVRAAARHRHAAPAVRWTG